MSTVVILKCEDYNPELICEKLQYALKMIDFRPENYKKLLLKPNLLMSKKPEEATTTHPAVVEGLINILKKENIDLIVADSPGGPYNVKRLNAVYEKTGIKDVCEKTGTPLNYNTSSIEIELKGESKIKALPVIYPYKECDGVVSLAKLKTHGMAVYTGAVKNLYGMIPGGYKVELHFRIREIERFMDLLLDMYETINPLLSIIDGVIAMEGDGPSQGTGRKLGILIISDDALAADYAASRIINLSKNDFPLIKRAIERGLFKEESIRFVGDSIDSVKVNDFKIPLKKDMTFIRGILPRFLEIYLKEIMTPKPYVVLNQCKGCSECYLTCPPKAICIEDKKAKIDYKKCIKCFCCHELCPYQAIKIRRNFIYEKLLK
ncbi:DUF362 domain-containing protein [Thermovenabulum gondwanense]|uniref:Ferredoxin n=1 Tax=Thermovenabulum gondwanense TaxID=520767 RepID=A0A162M838_9FIRM|nr:DUF362 domain-containing protein [Thermovenabulum gondwanense]KYO64500.1 hypothetical protein ATZ99_19320 [Thermovenabulum gondwanense]